MNAYTDDKGTSIAAPTLDTSQFRGVLWSREAVNGVYRCIVVGVVTSNTAFALPDQAIVNTDGQKLLDAIRNMTFRDDPTPVGDASNVLLSLNSPPFIDL